MCMRACALELLICMRIWIYIYYTHTHHACMQTDSYVPSAMVERGCFEKSVRAQVCVCACVRVCVFVFHMGAPSELVEVGCFEDSVSSPARDCERFG